MIDCRTFNQIVRYLLMTGLSASITLGIPVLLHEVFSLEEEIAVATALIAAFFINFFTIRYYVFSATGGVKGQAARYVLTSIAFRVSEYFAFIVLHTFLNVYYTVALVIIMVTTLVIKFVVNRLYVFRTRGVDDI